MLDKKLPVVLSQEEVKQIIDCISNVKHRTFISLIYSCGLRVSELNSLKESDIDSARMQIHIRAGKGGKDRYVMDENRIQTVFQQYGEAFRKENSLSAVGTQNHAGNRTMRYGQCRVPQFYLRALRTHGGGL